MIYKNENYMGFVISFHTTDPRKYVNAYAVKGKSPSAFGGFKVTGNTKAQALQYAKKYIKEYHEKKNKKSMRSR